MTRVLLVDDHAAFRQPLAFMLGREPDLEVVGQAGSLAEARELVAAVDLAIVDLGLPDGDGVDLIRDLRAANPHGAVLVLTAETAGGRLARAIEAGASGVLHKSAGVAEIVGATRKLVAGAPLMTAAEVIELLRLADRERDRVAEEAVRRLTPRECEVLAALAGD